MKKILIIVLIFVGGFSYSQNEDIDLEDFAERLFQIQDENINYEDIYESLLLYYSNKLNLNKVTDDELASLYILNTSQLSNFFSYREQFGKFLSFNELQVIPTFNLEIIEQLRPFVTVEESTISNHSLIRRIIKEENNYFILRHSRTLEKQRGYTDSQSQRYHGSPDQLYGRFRTSHKNDFSLGFTFEKDPGEQFTFSDKQKGFDFYSYHLMLENKFGFRKIILGDFQLQVGQGLVYGAGFNVGKGAETVQSTKRNSLGLRPYTSVLESGFFRGVGISKTIKNFETTFFYSRLNQDGNIQTDTTFSDFDDFVNAIQNTGFHRTSSEISNKNQIVEQSIGGVFQYRPNRRFLVGAAILNSQYSTAIQRKSTNYNQFEFNGNHQYIISLFSNFTWKNYTFFGEVARSKSGGIGAIGGVVATLSKAVDFSMVFRNYDRNFHSFYGNSFSENSRSINENGIYWGLSIKPNRKHKINLYYDRFKFPWLRFRTDAPSVGNEWLVRYAYFPSKKIKLYVQIRQQKRQVTIPNDNLNTLVDQIKRNYLFSIDYQLDTWLKLRTKIQSSTQKEGTNFTKGFAIVQDVNFSVWKLKFYTRMALFETDNFNNAQYVYENNVLYSFFIPAYSGSGIRSYAMVRFDPFKRVSVWFRYARSNFKNQDTVGSGLDEAQGNVSSQITTLLRFKF